MPTEITTAAALLDYPPGSVFTARSGEVWMLERVHTMGSTNDMCAHLASPETPHASSTDVLRKWGPLTPQWRPDRPAQPTVQPSVEEVARALADESDDGCFDRIDEWESQEDWEREAYPDNHPTSDYEDAEHWTRLASRLFTGGLIGGRTEQEVIDSFLTRLGEAVAQFSGDQRLIEHAAAIRAGEQ